jgi:hypothetical protein
MLAATNEQEWAPGVAIYRKEGTNAAIAFDPDCQFGRRDVVAGGRRPGGRRERQPSSCADPWFRGSGCRGQLRLFQQ